MSRRLDENVLRRAERAHYDLQSALFMVERHDLDGLSLFAADEITEPDWNHAALVSVSAAEATDRLAEASAFYRERGRPPAVAVSPFSQPADLALRLRDLGYEPAFHHTWLFAPQTAPPEVPLAAGVDVLRVESAEHMRNFVDVFDAVYDTVGEGYGRALSESFGSRTAGVEVAHYLATVNGTPAGVATSLNGHGVTGLYNLAVAPAHRRHGLGAALTARRVADALERGQDLVFLQTERASVESWQRRHGFVKGFTTEGYRSRSPSSTPTR